MRVLSSVSFSTADSTGRTAPNMLQVLDVEQRPLDEQMADLLSGSALDVF